MPLDEAIDAFISALVDKDAARARQVLGQNPAIAAASLHVAAVLGDAETSRRLIAEDPSRVSEKRGEFGGDPLLHLCYSPFHGESRERNAGLLETARVLLAAGADPNTRDSRFGVPALFAVTAERTVLPIASLLIEAGANPTDGESMHHSAERYHRDAMEFLIVSGCDLNHVGEWGNTPLYFLLRWYPLDLADEPRLGVEWLLGHGADPNVRCGPERETSLHVAARRGQPVDVIKTLIAYRADVNATREDGATAWLLAKRGAHDDIAEFLEGRGAETQPLTRLDELLRACAAGDATTAARLASPEFVPTIDARDEAGATALHYAAFNGKPNQVRALLAAGADPTVRDGEHDSTPLAWAYWAVENNPQPGAEYERTIEVFEKADPSLRSG